MDRRKFAIMAGAALAAPRALLAQPAKRVYRIAFLDDAGEGAREEIFSALINHLRERGFVEGRNLIVELRRAQGMSERLNSLAAELVATKPDVIVTPGTPTTRAAMRATSSIPIVFLGAADPLGAGLVASLARPGGNVTGISIVATETSQKTLELLHELLPGAQRIAYLTDPANPVVAIAYSRLEEKARALKLSLQMLDGNGSAALERSFAAIRQGRVQGLLVGFVGTLTFHRDEIVRFAAREKLPTVYGWSGYVHAGGLMSYDVDRKSGRPRAAELIQKIFRGTKPADLPVEQISKTLLSINMKTSRALGIKIPESILLRADEVIE
jgi:putative ABC transport system substrate-binding protein